MTYKAPDLSNKLLKVAAFDISFDKKGDAISTSEGRWGAFHSMGLVIEYQETWPCRAKFADTLMHEIGHAIYWAYGLRNDDDEERIVATFATAWVQVFRDNRWLLDTMKKATA